MDFLNGCDIYIDCNYLEEVFKKEVLHPISYYTYEKLDQIICTITNQYEEIEITCTHDIYFAAREGIYLYKLNPYKVDEDIFTM